MDRATAGNGSHPDTAVIVTTTRRPDDVLGCLDHLSRQRVAPDLTVVLDASPDGQARAALRGAAGVRYVRARPDQPDRVAQAIASQGAVVAFVDADAWPREDWLAELLARLADPAIAAAGGREVAGRANEEREGLGETGLLLLDGRLTRHFAADPGRDVAVDHLSGSNLAVRASVLAEVADAAGEGGAAGDWSTSLLLRARRAGH